MGFFALLSPRTWKLVGVGAAVLLVLFLYFQFAGAVRNWWAGDTKQIKAADQATANIDKVLADAAAKDKAISDLAKEIANQRQAWQAALARAEALQADRDRWRAEASRLGDQVAALEAKRKALAPVATLPQAREALQGLGYGAPR